MAKQWLIQFEDGIWSPDPVRQDYGSDYHVLSELREFFKGVLDRMPLRVSGNLVIHFS
jgi:hypothetical protein